MKELLAIVTVATPVVNTLSDDGVITALDLEDAVFFGMTYGAWFKVGMGVALLLLIAERCLTLIEKSRGRNETASNSDK